MPAKADFRYPLLIVITVMLLYGIWPGFRSSAQNHRMPSARLSASEKFFL
jgi:hypothetical protein